jgi:hypothetical protein
MIHYSEQRSCKLFLCNAILVAEDNGIGNGNMVGNIRSSRAVFKKNINEQESNYSFKI